jgi:hypothetical protein
MGGSRFGCSPDRRSSPPPRSTSIRCTGAVRRDAVATASRCHGDVPSCTLRQKRTGVTSTLLPPSCRRYLFLPPWASRSLQGKRRRRRELPSPVTPSQVNQVGKMRTETFAGPCRHTGTRHDRFPDKTTGFVKREIAADYKIFRSSKQNPAGHPSHALTLPSRCR